LVARIPISATTSNFFGDYNHKHFTDLTMIFIKTLHLYLIIRVLVATTHDGWMWLLGWNWGFLAISQSFNADLQGRAGK
jgi:hypothetical protein